MNRMTPTIALATLLVAGVAQSAHGAGKKTLRRFALAIGANDGGKDRVTLRYAGTDAKAFAKVLRDLGGAADADVEVLVDPSVEEIDAGFAHLSVQMVAARANGDRVELIVYYSGHSDEEGLLISGKRLSYNRLRDKVRAMPADVHIAILDSCASGAFTRTKGGQRKPAFLADESHRVQGHAFLSSSSAAEQAQESERLRGSFFTHYFVGGLRGAADSNRDSRVTLNEAYQFAFSETVSRTQKTRYGAQHPAYDMHLVGTGDVILTDLRATSAALVLAKDLSGRLTIRDDSQRLILELTKAAGAPVVLGLGPNTYHLTLDDGEDRFAAIAKLSRGKRTTVSRANFASVSLEMTTARGDDAPYDRKPFNLELFSIPDGKDREVNNFSLNLFVGGGARLDGFELGGIANMRTDSVSGFQIAGITNLDANGAGGLQIAGIANLVRGPVRGVEIEGIANLVHGDSAAIQIAGITSWTTGRAGTLQLSGIASVAGEGSDGAQISGIANVAGDQTNLQVAGIANLAHGVGPRGVGVQIAGISNVSRDDVRGLQVAGIANVTMGDVRGSQISLVNIGSDVRGAQIGLVNVAQKMSGLQLGIVNVATESSKGAVPLGLVNGAPDGHRAVEAWIADIVPVRVGVKLGSGRVYTLFAAGVSNDHLAGGLGLGVHLPGRSFWVDIDAASYALFEPDFSDTDSEHLTELRVMAGLPLGIGLSVFAGISANGVVTFDGEPGRDLALITLKRIESDQVTVRLSPGLFAGISY